MNIDDIYQGHLRNHTEIFRRRNPNSLANRTQVDKPLRARLPRTWGLDLQYEVGVTAYDGYRPVRKD